MILTNAISESLIEDTYFGLPKQLACYKALKIRPFGGAKGITHLGVNVVKINDGGLATSHVFSVDDILNTEWVVKEQKGEINNDQPSHAGIVTVATEELEKVVEILETEGYGTVDSYDSNLAADTVTVFCHSHLFSKVESGSPTPNYTLVYEEDTNALTAQRISV